MAVGGSREISLRGHSESRDLPPILVFPDGLDLRASDSSDFATGAVLSQQSPEDNKWHPVAYYSKSLMWWTELRDP